MIALGLPTLLSMRYWSMSLASLLSGVDMAISYILLSISGTRESLRDKASFIKVWGSFFRPPPGARLRSFATYTFTYSRRE